MTMMIMMIMITMMMLLMLRLMILSVSIQGHCYALMFVSLFENLFSVENENTRKQPKVRGF